jgi:hypothetical protein
MATVVTHMRLHVALLCTLLFASSLACASSKWVIHTTLISIFLTSVCVGWVIGLISLGCNNIQKFEVGLQVREIYLFFCL